jgi:hypothetical protein
MRRASEVDVRGSRSGAPGGSLRPPDCRSGALAAIAKVGWTCGKRVGEMGNLALRSTTRPPHLRVRRNYANFLRVGSAAGLPPPPRTDPDVPNLKQPARPVADSGALRYPWSFRGELIGVQCPGAVARHGSATRRPLPSPGCSRPEFPGFPGTIERSDSRPSMPSHFVAFARL